MKRLLVAVILSLVVFVGQRGEANPVEPRQALAAAEKFLNRQGGGNIHLVDRSNALGIDGLFLFTGNDGKGFVLMSSDDCVIPVLGYSVDDVFETEDLPDNVKWWLGNLSSEILFWRELEEGDVRGQSPSGSFARQRWNDMLNGIEPPQPYSVEVSPLINTTWGQRPLYNNLCPYDNAHGELTLAGCVAVAMAQIMKYWNHPGLGYGSHSYIHSTYGTQSANFGNTYYAWSQMPQSLSVTSNTAQVNAVATLMYHLGVAVNMNYGVNSEGGSGAYNFGMVYPNDPAADNALRTYFRYKSNVRGVHKSEYSDAAWRTLLMNELNNGRPILYGGYSPTGSGHSFVCDGYNMSGLFHFNWGWRGSCNGFFAIGSLNPGDYNSSGVYVSYSYNVENTAVVGIEPNAHFGDTTFVSAVANNSAYGNVSGGGIYTGVNATNVTLRATAAEGYRFAGWDDGYGHNPRYFYANGGSYSYTANFEPLTGDTLTYSANTSLSGYGGSSAGSYYWGIKLPASTLPSGHELNSVQLYLREAGAYELTIYTGYTSPDSAIYVDTFMTTSADNNKWYTHSLLSPVAVESGKSVWITFHTTTMRYPASITYSAGNSNSLLWGSSFSPLNYNYSFMIKAIFAPPFLPTDTVSFCGDSSIAMNIGGNRTMHWGIRLPDTMHNHRNTLAGVMLYIYYPGTYKLMVFQGDTTDESTMIATQEVTYSTSQSRRWNTIQLPIPVMLQPTQPLWITFRADNIDYPAAMSSHTGDTNGSLMFSSRFGGWVSLIRLSGGYYTGEWMIKALLSQTESGDEPDMEIIGPEMVGTDLPGTFTTNAPANAECVWQAQGAEPSVDTGASVNLRWSSVGRYSVVATVNNSGAILRDTLEVEVTECGVTEYPFVMGFEATEDKSCWYNNDADGDGDAWVYTPFGAEYVHSGSRAIRSESQSAATDNWLVTPKMMLDSGYRYVLSWYDRVSEVSSNGEHYQVLLSQSGNSERDFGTTPLFDTSISEMEYAFHEVDISSHEGQEVFLAFRHIGSTGGTAMLLDEIGVRREALEYTLTVTSATPSMGTVTGGGTFGYGSRVTLSATATAGNHFRQWSDGNREAVRFVTVRGDASYMAYFAEGTTVDTVTLRDTTYIYDTTFVFDTTVVDNYIYDTTYVYDTITETNYIHDTTVVDHYYYDTVTLTVEVHDTMYVHDTAIVNHYIHDTVYVNYFIHDTTFVDHFIHDTLTLTTYVHDTVYINDTTVVYNYLHDTLYLHDTTIVNNYIHDTTYVPTYVYDTTYIPTYVHDTTVVHNYIHDTVSILQPIQYYNLVLISEQPERGIVVGDGRYSDSTVVEIAAISICGSHLVQWSDGETSNPRHVMVTEDMVLTAMFEPDDVGIGVLDMTGVTITTNGNNITVEGAEGQRVRVFDVTGRLLCTENNVGEIYTFRVVSTGVYLVQVGDAAAHRVVIKK